MEDRPNYERIVSWLMENCSPEFSELLMLESPKDILYLSDIQTYELYFLSLTRGGKRSYINMKGLGCRC